MLIGGLAPVGSSRDQRLDPFSLPVHFAVNDKTADDDVRVVELSHERVIVRRAVRGMKMAINVPINTYRGVAIRIEPPAGADHGAMLIMLEHRDPGLSLPLYRADSGADIIAEWQSWARVLCLPPLVVDSSGGLREPFARLGALRVSPPTPRRRRHSSLPARRPILPLRRRPGRAIAGIAVHRGEREIIAPD